MKNTAHIFKALSEETRLRIMALLVSGQELCVCDVMAALNIPQSTASRHLSYLKNAGIVDDRRQGIWMYYKINHEGNLHTSILFDLLAAIFAEDELATNDMRRLKDHLTTKKKACN